MCLKKKKLQTTMFEKAQAQLENVSTMVLFLVVDKKMLVLTHSPFLCCALKDRFDRVFSNGSQRL